MDTSIEDFQEYHNRQSLHDIDANLPSSPPALDHSVDDTGREIDDDEASLSGSAHHSSGPDEAVFDQPTRTSSPRTSNGSEDEISILESHYDLQNHTSSPFTPLKTRSPFRNPSSVRAIQLDTTPPHLISPSSQQRHKFHTPSRQGTPRSVHSHRNTTSMSSPSKLGPTKKLKKEYPLVLLHLTLLPIPLPYSQQTMESVLPPSILENWKLLLEKATPTVLERGILIPHPKEDYDLLEERLLESLELKAPRILKCGHFHLSAEEEADILAAGGESDSDNDDTNDADICLDCGRRIRDGRFGTAGEGSKRWNIKLFAANGLMRAGAWSAAWREMERVDVEILPWMEEDMKRELELRSEEEEEAKVRSEQQQAPVEREAGVAGLAEDRLREIYGDSAMPSGVDQQAFVDGFGETTPIPTPKKPSRRRHRRRVNEETPLSDLLLEYIRHAADDRRNIAIFILSVIILFLSVHSPTPPPRLALQTVNHNQDGFPTSTPTIPAVKGGESCISSSITESLVSSILAKTTISSISTPTSSSSPSGTTEQVKEDDNNEEQEPESEQASSWIETVGDVVEGMVED